MWLSEGFLRLFEAFGMVWGAFGMGLEASCGFWTGFGGFLRLLEWFLRHLEAFGGGLEAF